MAAVFDGMRVLDFSQGMAGSLATMLLADNGAEVIKVEPPGGDPCRSEASWIMWNRGKKSVVLDLDTPAGRGSAQGMARAVDVLVDTFRPGTAKSLGLDYAPLARENPGLVYCSITPMGSKGAHADLPMDEGVVQAKIGAFMDMKTQLRRNDPAYRVRPMGSYGAANLAVQGIAAALRVRLKTGQGQRLETSLLQGYGAYDFMSAMNTQAAKGLTPPLALGARSALIRKINLAYMPVRCGDGQWLQMACMAARLFPNWMRAIGLDSIYKDPRFKGAPFVFPAEEDAFALRDLILGKMREKTAEEWLDLFKKLDVAGDRFLTTQQFMDHPQIPYIQGVVEIEDPGVGKSMQIGPLVRFQRTPAVIGAPAPRLGEHTDSVLTSVRGSPATSGARPPPWSKAPRYPLEGLLVLDFATWLAAPVGTSLLADLGARVIKIEPPAGDEFRPSSQGLGRTFQGKESLVVDLKTEEGKKLIRPLIARADGLVHNMRGDAPARTGTDYAAVRKINPEIVYLYGGSYGSTGPGAGRAAFHPIGGCMSGAVLWQMGRDNQPSPADVPMSLEEIADYSMRLLWANEGSPDVTSAIAVGTALAMALFEKERTGKGQYLETSMLLSNAYICSDDFVRYDGKPPRQETDRHQRGLHALYRLYNTASGWVFLACRTQEAWERFCTASSAIELLSDHRFSDADARRLHDNQLIAEVARILKAHPAVEWEATLRASGVACVRADACAYDEFFLTDPQVKENGLIVEAYHPTTRRMMRQGPPVLFSMTPGKAEAAHAFGSDTPAVLRELGVSEREMTDLRRRGVVSWPDGAVV